MECLCFTGAWFRSREAGYIRTLAVTCWKSARSSGRLVCSVLGRHFSRKLCANLQVRIHQWEVREVCLVCFALSKICCINELSVSFVVVCSECRFRCRKISFRRRCTMKWWKRCKCLDVYVSRCISIWGFLSEAETARQRCCWLTATTWMCSP